MRADVQEIYATVIHPLPDEEKLQIATLILEAVTKHNVADDEAKQPQRKGGDITKFFGRHKGGDPHGSDNEKIDADLARAYLEDYERSS